MADCPEESARNSPESLREFTRLLNRHAGGDETAFVAIAQLAYEDLRGLARGTLHNLFGGGTDHLTLSATEIANEVVMRLQQQRSAFVNREHFFSVATDILIRLIRDYQRKRLAGKRDVRRTVPIEEAKILVIDAEVGLRDEVVDVVNSSLQSLSAQSPLCAEVGTLHLFCGLSIRDIASLLDISKSQVETCWKEAKKHLEHALSDDTRP